VLIYSILAMTLRALLVTEGESIAREAIDRGSRFLASLVRLTFVHHAGLTVDELIALAIQGLERLRLMQRDAAGRHRVLPGSDERLAILAGLVESTIEGHGAVARALLVLRAGPMLRRPLEAEVLEQLHRWYLTGELRRFESCQTSAVHTAIDWLCDEGILVQQGEGKSVEVQLAKRHANGRALEVLVERTGRLLPKRTAA
jgi:hypothetical protein